ncbi:MAG: SDR family oxidoreductase [Candidatus Omnitrophica bacterium]|nr:SDR family oxidoreductase [Candidatus Omnitrophota bacterium]MCM8831328.1 SDR family oxidoreductase [Candidatus Omnitrophota bacterium]
MMKRIFITGVTGLVGSYLAKIFLQNQYIVYALARSKNNQSAKKRVLNILKFWDKNIFKKIKNLIILEGDITKKNLGLSSKNAKKVMEEIEEIFHCAAITKFNLPIDVIRKPNVEGTKNVLDFALSCKNLKKINHISTAYVAGNHKGVFKEENLDLGQNFDTTYEQSKFEAEKLVEEYRKKGLWIDIFRPPLIIGESITGKTPLFNMAVYQVLHLWKQEILDIFPAKDVNVNIVPVDWLCQSIYLIFSKTTTKNRNYHPFSSQTICLENIMNWLAEKIGFKKPKVVTPFEFKNFKLSVIQKLLLANNLAIFNPYLVLDSSLTLGILKQYGFVFPKITKKSFLPILLWPFTVKFKSEISI